MLLSPEEVMLPRLDFQDLNMQRRRYSGLQGYVNSKLCMILAAREFQRRFDRCAAWRCVPRLLDWAGALLEAQAWCSVCRLGQSARGLNAFFCSVHPGGQVMLAHASLCSAACGSFTNCSGQIRGCQALHGQTQALRAAAAQASLKLLLRRSHRDRHVAHLAERPSAACRGERLAAVVLGCHAVRSPAKQPVSVGMR